jgi:1,2-dihydroxy-3-keto-5-methylthiopentene dioxygenase
MRAYRLDEPALSISPEALSAFGVLSWRVPADDAQRTATIDAIKRERGYVDEDFVALNADTPNLDAICAKFDAEHYHTEDEVRFVVEGDGIFDVRDESDHWIRIEVAEGDIIVIPARAHHRFYLTERKNIRCMRLFVNNEGWTPLYRDAG